ncbi:MAG TPA: hypothetical protein VF659_15495 [Pyrinomonadaceae bacterium]|jgi:chromosome segregation ATPase
MSDNPTQQIPDSRSFEERVFARFDNLDGRLTTLEEKVDSRLRETRPIWEAMQADLAYVKDDVTKVKSDVKEIKYTWKAMHKEILRVRIEREEIEERIEKLESQSKR